MKKMYQNFFVSSGIFSVLTKSLSFFLLLLLSADFVQAQCTTSPNGQWPSGTFPAPGGPVCPGPAPTVNVNTALFTGEYSVISFQAQTYTVGSSVSTDYITVTNAAGTTVLTHGAQPLSVVIPAAASYRVYRHSNSSCLAEGVSRTMTLTCTTCPPPAATIVTAQPLTTAVTGGSLNAQVARLAVSNQCGTLTQLDLSTTGTTNAADILNAKVYYTTTTTFSNATQFGTTVTAPNGNFSVTGSQSLSTTLTNYFWVVYDIQCSAPSATGNTVDASIDNFVVEGVGTVPATTNPTGTRTITALTASAVTNQPSTATVASGSLNNQVLRTQVTSCAGATVTSFDFTTSGSTNAGTDIAAAKVFYTATTTFDATTQFGATVSNPNGTFTVTGSQALATGTGYFWLVYDISATATEANVVDAGCISATAGGSALIPATPNPTGTRTIANPPINDVCAGAIALPVNSSCVGATYSTQGATDNNETGDCTNGTETAVWFRFVATQTTAVVSVTGSIGFDAVLGVLNACGSTVSPTGGACIDATLDAGTETRSLSGLTVGNTYYIQVYDYQGDVTAASTFSICVYAEACSTPTSAAATSVTQNTANANWTPTTGNFIIEYGPTATFTPTGTGAAAGNANNLVATASNVGTLQLTGLLPSTGYSYVIRQDCSATSAGFSANSTTRTFTTAGVPPTCTNNTTPANGAVNVPYAAGVQIAWNEVPTATGYQVWWSNNGGTSYTNLGTTANDSILITGTSPLTTYYYYIVPVNGTTPAVGCSSNFTSFTTGAAPPVPTNDDCGAPLTIGTVPISATTLGATQSLAAQSCAGFTSPSAFDVWFQFTAASNGSATVNLTNPGLTLDAVIQVYSGTCATLGTPIACADATTDGGVEVATLNGLVQGQTYLVRVYGYDGAGGTFDISVTGGALPIAIEYFRGTKQNGKNVLDWKVSCYNSPSVTLSLERSADGRNYKEISRNTETAARCLQPFNHNDVSPLAGINYYRLKSIDVDGKVTYSSVVALLNKSKGFEIVSLAPNPVQDKAILSVTSAERTIMEIIISDVNGKQISKQRVSLLAGDNQVPLQLGKAAAGTYQVTGLTADGETKTLRFVKQ